MTKLKSLPNFPQMKEAKGYDHSCGTRDCNGCKREARNLALSEVGELDISDYSVPSVEEISKEANYYIDNDETSNDIAIKIHNLITKRRGGE